MQVGGLSLHPSLIRTRDPWIMPAFWLTVLSSIAVIAQGRFGFKDIKDLHAQIPYTRICIGGLSLCGAYFMGRWIYEYVTYPILKVNPNPDPPEAPPLYSEPFPPPPLPFPRLKNGKIPVDDPASIAWIRKDLARLGNEYCVKHRGTIVNRALTLPL